ncbi:MAG TPA: prolyl oligopeptidase family serine peptidase, partial [Bacteroidia bacterium]|nr:prolyl oligopeptidase family serine peptidase [Bacteroidia bacterium]
DYRWLENDTSAETMAWVDEEIKTTKDYLGKIPFRDKIKDRITELLNYPKYSAPFKVGEYYIFAKNTGLQNQSVYYIQKGLDGKEEVFLDPNTLSKDGTVSINFAGYSKNKKYIAYTLQRAGSDWEEIYVMDIASKKQLADKLEWVKFSGASWYKDGFFYNRFDKPVGSALAAANEYQKVYFHKLGDPQEKDQLIFEDKTVKQMYYGVSASEDERYWFLTKSKGTGNWNLFFMDKENTAQKDWAPLTTDFTSETSSIETEGDNIFLITNDGAPNKKVVLVDVKHPEKKNWKDLIPERTEYMDFATPAGKNIFVSYLKDVTSQVEQFDYTGKLIRKIQLPDLGDAGGFSGEKDSKEIFYTFTSFLYPYTIYKYDIASGRSEIFRAPEVKFNKDEFETKQVFFASKDGTKIPMFIVCKKGTELNGKNPTLMYGYGGFSVVINPSFSASRIAFLEQGGVYALVNLRGGNEYGEKWHEGGMLLNKQNVFDDFIAGGEYLISQKYTSPDYLAIQGGSNGGLLVGACMTQRPDLFRVAIPMVGVMDMMRFHKFTVGFGWIDDYGNPDDAKFTKYIHAYSPFHNIKSGVKYPATMVTTGDHDDRVVPAHSFKFGARLQALADKSNPALIRIEKSAGHGAGKPLSKTIEETADIYSFILYNMGIDVKYASTIKN